MNLGLSTSGELLLPGVAGVALGAPRDAQRIGEHANGDDAQPNTRSQDQTHISPQAIEADRSLSPETSEPSRDDQDPQPSSSAQTADAPKPNEANPAPPDPSASHDQGDQGEQSDGSDSEQPTSPDQKAPDGSELTEEEQDQVEQLQQIDREVRQHEAAHKAAAGPYARGGPTYEFQQGPDGRRYAVGGSVQIDTSPIPGDPQATIQKMQVVRRAALAPAEPSSQDRSVAAQASRAEQQARQELREQQTEQTEQSGEADGSAESTSSTAGGQNNTSETPEIDPTHHGDQKRSPESQPEIGALVDAIG